jgi:hypothetical protein
VTLIAMLSIPFVRQQSKGGGNGRDKVFRA